MKRFSLYALTATVALGLGAAFTGCDAAGPEASADVVAAPIAFDGETLLRGVAFGQGPVAEFLPEVWGTPAVVDALAAIGPEEQRAIDALVHRVVEADPGLLLQLEADMASGDVRRVLASLDAAAVVLNRHIGDASQQAGKAEDRVIRGVVIEPVCGSVIVLICAVILWQQSLDEGGGLTEQTTLAREEIAFNLAQRLVNRPAVSLSR